MPKYIIYSEVEAENETEAYEIVQDDIDNQGFIINYMAIKQIEDN